MHPGETILIRTEKRDNQSPLFRLLKYFNNKKIIYICSNKSPCDLIYNLKKIQLCLDNVCIINTSGLNDLEEGNVKNIDSRDLTKICIELNNLIQKSESENIIILDCPLGFLFKNKVKDIENFILYIIKKVKINRHAILIIICNHHKKMAEVFKDMQIFVDKLYEY